MKNLESQEALILKDLKAGKKITTLDAIYSYGAARLSARIFNLKKKHPAITGQMITIKTRLGNKRVMRYSL